MISPFLHLPPLLSLCVFSLTIAQKQVPSVQDEESSETKHLMKVTHFGNLGNAQTKRSRFRW